MAFGKYFFLIGCHLGLITAVVIIILYSAHDFAAIY